MPVSDQDFLPHIEDFNTVINTEEILIEDSLLTTAEEDDAPVPLGLDISWDFALDDFDLNSSRGLKVTNEINAMHQWVVNTLTIPKGSLMLYSRGYGSDLPGLIGSGLNLQTISPEIVRAVREAMLQHDRVEDVNNITLESLSGGETVQVSFTVLLDTDAQLEFRLAAGA